MFRVRSPVYECIICFVYKLILLSGYITDVLDDAKTYSNHAGRSAINLDDVKLSVQTQLDHSFTGPPPRDVIFY